MTWLTIDPLESLGAGLSREAVMAAIGQRVRAEPVDASLCEREPIHIPGSIQPNAVMLAADAATLLVLAYSANCPRSSIRSSRRWPVGPWPMCCRPTSSRRSGRAWRPGRWTMAVRSAGG